MEGDTGQQKSVKETPIEHTNKLMKTSHDDILGIARNEPLNKEMLHLIGMNLEGLQIIVKRFENELIATKDELLEMLAKERLERAILIGRMGCDHLKYSDDSLGEIPDEGKIAVGDVVTIKRNERKIWTASLYIRPHLIVQIKKVRSFLDDTGKLMLYVTGAPGCGKTCFFWMWAGILLKQKKRVLFIQYRIKVTCQIWILEDGTMKRLTSPMLEPDNLKVVLRDLMKARALKFDVCICDGVRPREETCKKLVWFLTPLAGDTENHMISKLILISSLQFSSSSGETMSVDDIDKMVMDSWREDDYEKAVLVENEAVKAMLLEDWKYLTGSLGTGEDEKAKLLEVVREKYHFAGGCARYMFDRNMVSLKEHLDEQLGRVDDWARFARTTLPDSTSEAVNSLMQQFFSVEKNKSMCIPVSKYVLGFAYDICHEGLTIAVEAAADATKIRSLIGWAFELSQKDIIRSALEDNLAALREDRAVTKAVGNGKLIFFPRARADFNGSTMTIKSGGGLESGTIIWCSKDDPGLFDAAVYFDNTLVTLQFAAAKTHLVNFEFVTSLRTEIIRNGAEVNDVFDLVIINENEEDFKFETLTGQEVKVTRTYASRKAAAYATMNALSTSENTLLALKPVSGSETLVASETPSTWKAHSISKTPSTSETALKTSQLRNLWIMKFFRLREPRVFLMLLPS